MKWKKGVTGTKVSTGTGGGFKKKSSPGSNGTRSGLEQGCLLEQRVFLESSPGFSEIFFLLVSDPLPASLRHWFSFSKNVLPTSLRSS